MPGILRPGRNCWRVVKANHLALLIDASNYYGALLKAMKRASRSFALIGWDLDTRMELFDTDPDEGTGPLGEFMRQLAADRPNLHSFILPWSFPILFANVRDPKLVFGKDPFQHPRIHFKMDGVHPPGAGLGLAITRGIVEAHRGTVDVRNTDLGCEFRIVLPAYSPGATA